jgi:hypothetical protein
MVEVHPEQDKECILCVTKGKLAAERIENTHLREAFVTMEKAANQREAEVERLNDELNGTIQLGNQAREQLIALRQCVADDRAVCLCGCPADAHESYGEDGESCGCEDHDCLRVCAGAADAVAALRSRALAQGMYAAWDEATEDAKVSRRERDAARAELEAAFREGWIERGLLPDCGIPPLHSCQAAWQARQARGGKEQP